LALLPTATLPAADIAREAATASEKNGVTGEAEAADQSQVQNVSPAQVETRPPIPWTWPIILAGMALVSALIMLLMRRLAAERWQRK
jgi:hypothetical protein